ncbi:hypothetical protein L1987_54997 [Smallanthus sonchifolius]|uniref:Uncharacterized protein n=1 Tax=Smallanthus sonchifolius TaxID=185202 RepID=A0ACB9E9R7_9ASTR|nr:hypothetical protein L1987_54997 [Smallanthus sonchifolius]
MGFLAIVQGSLYILTSLTITFLTITVVLKQLELEATKESSKKTLLKDYERCDKSLVSVVKRIGEQNKDLGEFEKAIIWSRRI